MTQRFLSGLIRETVLIRKIHEAIVIEVKLDLNDTSNDSNSASD
jgi:hypothetical protein